MMPLGMRAPNFDLRDTEGQSVKLSDFKKKRGLLVMFICNHCPYVIHLQEGLAALGRDFLPQGLGLVAINSNDPIAYPEDSPEKMVIHKRRAGYSFPYLFDADQSVAKAYQAACTPDFFLFDQDFALVYRGEFDGSRPGKSIPVTGRDLRAAIEALLAGKPISPEQKPSLGCSIKWK